MKKAPRLTGKDIIKILGLTDFKVVRVKGSHHILKHPDGRTTIVPVHGKEI